VSAPQPAPDDVPAPRRSLGLTLLRFLLHAGFLLISLACLAAYLHLKVEGHSTAALVTLGAGAVFAFLPARDLFRLFFRIEGWLLHLVHAIGALALLILPLIGVVPGAPVLSHAAMAPFAIMGAAQALMNRNHPRNAKQAAALSRFVASLPEVGRLNGFKDLGSPANALRAVAVLSDIVGKAQALGEAELESDPGFQGALQQASGRFGGALGLDAVEAALAKVPTTPATAAAIQALRGRVVEARKALAGAHPPSP
jgi:hypothetical protein